MRAAKGSSAADASEWILVPSHRLMLCRIEKVMSTVLGEVNMDEAGFGGTLDLPQAR